MKLEQIEGIGPKFAAQLRRAGVRSTDALLKAGGTRRERQELARRSGISGKLILEWVNLADLIRIKGVGEEYSDLLEEAGVDSVKELRLRTPEHLHRSLVETNRRERLVRRLPSLNEVRRWVRQARRLPRAVTH